MFCYWGIEVQAGHGSPEEREPTSFQKLQTEHSACLPHYLPSA